MYDHVCCAVKFLQYLVVFHLEIYHYNLDSEWDGPIMASTRFGLLSTVFETTNVLHVPSESLDLKLGMLSCPCSRFPQNGRTGLLLIFRHSWLIYCQPLY